MGLSIDPAKVSYQVAQYLQSAGYHVITVNPFGDEVLGEISYKNLLDAPETIEVVDIFRPSEFVPSIEEDAIKLKTKTGASQGYLDAIRNYFRRGGSTSERGRIHCYYGQVHEDGE